MVLRVWHLFVFALVVGVAVAAIAISMANHSTTTVINDSAAPRQPGHKVSLSEYFAHVKVQQDRLLASEAKASAALGTVSGAPDSNWSTAAVTIRQTRDEFTDIAIKLRLIPVPSEIAAEHRGLEKSFELFAAMSDGLQQALADSDQQAVIDAEARVNDQEIVELRTAWRNSVVALARTQHVPVPQWVTEVGTRG